MRHGCHAHGCTKTVPPRMLMCAPHWYSLPRVIQATVWREYRGGQEVDKRPSFRYLAVQRRAVALTAFKPNDEEAARVAAGYLAEAEGWRRRAIDAGQGDPFELIDGHEQSSGEG